MMKNSLYDADFYGWANEQAALLRAGRLADADIVNIAEEMECMGRTHKREFTSRLTVLLAHLLKWQYQPGHRGASWQASIRVQRRDLADHMEDNPSLEEVLPEAMARAYGKAVIEAGAETGLLDTIFPTACPWSFEELLKHEFWPNGQ